MTDTRVERTGEMATGKKLLLKSHFLFLPSFARNDVVAERAGAGAGAFAVAYSSFVRHADNVARTDRGGVFLLRLARALLLLQSRVNPL